MSGLILLILGIAFIIWDILADRKRDRENAQFAEKMMEELRRIK